MHRVKKLITFKTEHEDNLVEVHSSVINIWFYLWFMWIVLNFIY